MRIFASITAGLVSLLALSTIQPALAESEPNTLKVISEVAPFALSGSVEKTLSKNGDLYNSGKTGLKLSINSLVASRLENHDNQQHRVLRTQDGFDVVPITKKDGSVQTLVVINEATAPQRITFNLDIPSQSSVKILQSGEVLILDANGIMVGGISRPWAFDANQKPVRTQFQFSNGKLTQYVFHDASNFKYPIVADPWIGIDLYHHPSTSSMPQGYRINVKPTLWGLSMTSTGTWFAHRDEVVTKLKLHSRLWTNTIQEQFYCHIAGSPAGYPEYNMESWSPLVPWFTSLVSYKCNPHNGTWY
jgi:hypothetical protein